MSLKILDLIRSYQVTLEQIGDKYKTNCPFPDHADTDPSFVVYPATNSFYCFSCSRGGGPLSFIMYREQISHDEAQKRLEQSGPLSDLERLLQPEEIIPPDFNVETNFTVSSIVRTKLQQGVKWENLSPFLSRFDQQLATGRLDEQQAKEFIRQAYQLH